MAIAVLLGWEAGRRRRETWRRFARRHGLHYRRGTRAERPRVEGSLDGAPFSLYVAQASSDTGLLGVEEVVMALGVRGELPPGLHASRGGLLGDVESAVEGRAAAEGPPAFEARVRVVAHDPAEVPAFLTDRRRRALVRLMEVERSCLPQLKGARLELRDREMLSDLGRLEGRLRLLREVARNLGPEEG